MECFETRYEMMNVCVECEECNQLSQISPYVYACMFVCVLQVTSPGGTTASALYELEKGGFRTVVADAVWTAYRRSLELGGKSPNVGPGRNKTNEIITYRR